MTSKCRAKNPATCRTHGTGEAPTPAKDEAAKKEFFGENTWEKASARQEQVNKEIMRIVNKEFKRSLRNIDGFTGYVTGEGKRKVAAIVNDPDLRGWADHTEGDSSAAVKAVRQYFWENHDGKNDGGVSALATVRLFKSLGRARELGDGLRELALVQAQKPAVTAGFEARAEGIVAIFRKHGFMGKITHKELDREQRSFIMQVEEQAKGKYSKKPVEIMYRASDVKVSVRASIEDHKVSINQMQIIQYPYSNFSYDADKIAEDLTSIYNSDSYTKETQTRQIKL